MLDFQEFLDPRGKRSWTPYPTKLKKKRSANEQRDGEYAKDLCLFWKRAVHSILIEFDQQMTT